MAAKKRKEILDYYHECELEFAKGYDTAIIGVVEGFGCKMKVCYDQEKIIKLEMKKGLSKRKANSALKKSGATFLYKIKEEYLPKKYPKVEFLLVAGHEDAYVGLVNGFNNSFTACFDRAKVINQDVEDGMNYGDAEEFFEFNTIGAYVGEFTPVYITYF